MGLGWRDGWECLSDIDDIYHNASLLGSIFGYRIKPPRLVLSLRISMRDRDVRPRLRLVSASSSRPALCTGGLLMFGDLLRMEVMLLGQTPRWGSFNGSSGGLERSLSMRQRDGVLVAGIDSSSRSHLLLAICTFNLARLSEDGMHSIFQNCHSLVNLCV